VIHRLLRRTLPAPIYSRLGLARDAVDRARFRPYVATHVYGGRTLSVHLTDAMAQGWYDHDWPLPEEIDLLARRGRLRKGALVFEIGAHQGVVAMMLGDRVGPAGRVVAVEATLHNAEVAWRNVALNGLTQIAVVHAAGADAPGVLRFSPRMNGHVASPEEASVQVRALTVDELTARHGAPQLLFVDVEGYELHVLRGARHTLASQHPDLFIEIHVRAGLERFGTVDDLLGLIPPGYEILVARAERGSFLPLAEARDVLGHHARLVALWPTATLGA
jgi:FkbM family methyltransferase